MSAVVKHNYMCHICAKGFSLDLNFNYVIIDKISFFAKLPEITHTHKNRNFKSKMGNR